MKRVALAIGGLVAVAGAVLVSVTTVRFEPAAEPGPLGIVAAPSRVAAVASPDGAGLLVPVAGFARGEVRDSWGDARSGGRGHRGIDLMAACRTAGIPMSASFRYLLPFLGAMVAVLFLLVLFPQIITGVIG